MAHVISEVRTVRLQSLLWLSAAVLLLLAGCAGRSPAPNLYILSSLPENQAPVDKAGRTVPLQIGIGPVTVADYLSQPNLVTRSGNNELSRAPFDRWGGSLRRNVATVLADNLGRLMSTEDVHFYPWQRFITVDYRVAVDLIRLDGVLGEKATLVARWSIVDEREMALLMTRRSTIIEPVESTGYTALVAAQSRALEKLSRDIADSLKSR